MTQSLEEQAGKFRQIAERGIDAPHLALAELWKMLQDDLSLRAAAVAASKSEPENHDRQVRGLIDAYDEANPSSLPDPLLPMAILEALDRSLCDIDPEETEGSDPDGFSQEILNPPILADVDGQNVWIRRRLTRLPKSAVHKSQANHLQAWLRHHWVTPANLKGYEVEPVIDLSPVLADVLYDIRKAGNIKVLLGSFDDEVAPRWIPKDSEPCTTENGSSLEVSTGPHGSGILSRGKLSSPSCPSRTAGRASTSANATSPRATASNTFATTTPRSAPLSATSGPQEISTPS